MSSWQPGHKWNSLHLACSPAARAHNMFNTRNPQRPTPFNSMEDVVTTDMQHKQMIGKRMKTCFALESNDRVTLLPHFNFSSIRAPPLSRDL